MLNCKCDNRLGTNFFFEAVPQSGAVMIDRNVLFTLTGQSSMLAAVPNQGTVLVDLGPDDPEYISVDEQVRYHESSHISKYC